MLYLSLRWSIMGGYKQKTFQTFSSKRGPYERWTLTRSLKYSDLTWRLSVFWKTGLRGEVVVTGRSTVLELVQIYT